VLFRLRVTSDGVLLMCNRRVVEKIDGCVVEFSMAISFKNVEEDHFAWVFVVQMPTMIEGICGMNWLVC
jgi:hypothetical protein